MHDMITLAANLNRPVGEVLIERVPSWRRGARRSRPLRRPTPPASAGPIPWITTTSCSNGQLIREFPEQQAAQAERFCHILIDEMQDTNAVQVELVESIAAAGRATAVGDDAQSIYRFRGTTTTTSSSLPSVTRRPVQLEVNYRSTPQIVAFTTRRLLTTSLALPRAWYQPVPTVHCPSWSPSMTPTRKPAWSASRCLRSAKRGSRYGRWPCFIAIITTAS